MTKKERVLAALKRQPVDRIPRGEIGIDGQFMEKFFESEKAEVYGLKREVYIREALGMDFINIHEFPVQLAGYSKEGFPIYQSPYGDVYKQTNNSSVIVKPAVEDIEDVEEYHPSDVSVATTHLLDFYRDNTDFFLMCQIGGPVSSMYWALGMEDYMCYCMTDPELVAEMTGRMMKFEIDRAKLFIDKGAEAILITDDIAFNTGMLLPPQTMEEVAYPFYKKMVSEIKAHKDVPVILHSDGYLYDALDAIVDCGFDAIQSLQPSAGMDIEKVKKNYGDKLCLIGNMDLDQLLPFGTPEEVRAEAKRLAEVAGPEGFMLSTCNVLTDMVKVENAKAMYHFDEEE